MGWDISKKKERILILSCQTEGHIRREMNLLQAFKKRGRSSLSNSHTDAETNYTFLIQAAAAIFYGSSCVRFVLFSNIVQYM